MRRVLIALLAATPVFALAQSTAPAVGTIDRLPTTMNLAQCSGAAAATTPRVPRISDVSNLSLTWQVKLAADQTAFTPATGRFKVYASREAFQASNSTAPWSCDRNSANNTITRAQIGESAGYEAPAQIMGTPKSIAFQSIATALSLSCTAASSTTTLYLCVEWLPDNSGTAKGWATGSINFDPIQPSPPTVIVLSVGGGKLHVESCNEGTNNDTFIARATATGEDHWSSQEQDCDRLTISGLTNNQPYDVTVYAMSTANNPSAASEAVSGTPLPTDDFWEHYDGQDSGGCATGTGAAGILGALALLALTMVVRRRKS